MKEYICKEVQTDNGGYLEVETELIRCRKCKDLIVSAALEHGNGDVTNYYMCKHWHIPTCENGYCYEGMKKEE